MRVSLNKKLLPQYSTDKVKVYTVNQTAACKYITIQFVGGGHHLVYAEIPKGEIWIAESLPSMERKYFVYHELFEYNKMAMGLDYSTAHAMANRAEGKVRHGSESELDKLIKVEMEKGNRFIGEHSFMNGIVHLHSRAGVAHHSYQWKQRNPERRLSTLKP